MIIIFLLENSSLSPKNVGSNKQMWANAVGFLISQGADPSEVDHRGRNALHHASVSGDVKTLERLVKNGMSIEQQDNKGCTPLLTAAVQGQTEMVDYLTSQGNNFSIMVCQWLE